MIESVLVLATEAGEAAEGGFGLNFNILETNLFNLAILLGLIVFYGRKVLGQILGDRRSKIAGMLEEAEGRKARAAAALAEEEKKIALAQEEAERLRTTANERAAALAAEIAGRTERDIERMRESATRDLSAERERVLLELRKRVAALALASVTARLEAGLERTVQETLIDRALANLGGR